jgi:hypothetical protein
MIPDYSIKALYPLALAEGEGIGTAYEYYAKRRALARWLKGRPRPGGVLIAGLPEKYGSSLDFIQLGHDLGASKLLVIDDRRGALEKVRAGVTAAQQSGALRGVAPEYFYAADLAALDQVDVGFDLCLSSEVLQRLEEPSRTPYLEHLCRLSTAVALFVPNAGNRSHTTLSGLAGMDLSELRSLAGKFGSVVQAGYVDMPPFPPGLSRSPEQRTKAAAGRLEALAMAGLGYYARMENSFPNGWRRAHAHIIYGFIEARRHVDA